MKHKLPTISLLLITLLCSSVPAYSPGQFMLVDGAFTIPAKQAMTYKFTGDSKGGRVTGRFRATGGRGNDVEVYILDEDGYENWRNGHAVKTYYNSGRITVANIDVPLGKGKYILVFSNVFSAITPKAVEAKVKLSW